MKHLKTFEAYGYEYTFSNEEDLNEGFAEIKDSIVNFIKKNIMGEIPKETLDKITTEFRQDLPKLTPQFVNFGPKEKEKIMQSILKLQSSLPKIKSMVPISESVPQGSMTFGSEPIKSKGEESNILEKIFKGFILPYLTVPSLFTLIWKVVFEWWIMHRALIPLDLGIWGKVSLVILLLSTISVYIVDKIEQDKRKIIK